MTKNQLHFPLNNLICCIQWTILDDALPKLLGLCDLYTCTNLQRFGVRSL